MGFIESDVVRTHLMSDEHIGMVATSSQSATDELCRCVLPVPPFLVEIEPISVFSIEPEPKRK
jgi:hypothetical protein